MRNTIRTLIILSVVALLVLGCVNKAGKIYQKASAFEQAKRWTEAIKTYELVPVKSEYSTLAVKAIDRCRREQAVHELFAQAKAFEQQGKLSQAVGLYNQIVSDYAENRLGEEAKQRAARVENQITLSEAQKMMADLKFSDALAKLKTLKNPSLGATQVQRCERELAAKKLMDDADWLRKILMFDKAIEKYESVLTQYPDSIYANSIRVKITGVQQQIQNEERLLKSNPPVVWIAKETALRKGPSTSYSKLGKARRGQKYSKLGETKSYVKIACATGERAFVSKEVVSDTPVVTAAEQRVIDTLNARLFLDPQLAALPINVIIPELEQGVKGLGIVLAADSTLPASQLVRAFRHGLCALVEEDVKVDMIIVATVTDRGVQAVGSSIVSVALLELGMPVSEFLKNHVAAVNLTF